MRKEFKYKARRFLAVATLSTITLTSIGAYWQYSEKASNQENKKYELVETDYKTENNKKLYRIKALKNFGEDIRKGDLGDYARIEGNSIVEKEVAI